MNPIIGTDDTLKDAYGRGLPLLILLHNGPQAPTPLADAAAKLAAKHADDLLVVTVDAAANPTTAAKYTDLALPAVVAMEQRNFGIREASRMEGVRPADLRAYAAFLLGKGADPAIATARKPKRSSRQSDHGTTDVTERTFKKQVLRSKQPVLVDFWAPWCGPCRQVSPMVEALGRDYAGKLRVVKVNVDDNPKLSQRYEVRSIPSLVLFAGGGEVERLVGAHPRRNVEQMIERVMV